MVTIAIISKPFTFTNGSIVQASEHNSNFDTIYNDYNGNITNANIASGAAIADTKLAQITTSGKVSNVALTISGQLTGDILYYSGSAWTRLAVGTANQTLKVNSSGTNIAWSS